MMRFVPQLEDEPILIGPKDQDVLVVDVVEAGPAMPTQDGYYDGLFDPSASTQAITPGANESITWSGLAIRNGSEIQVAIKYNSSTGATSIYTGTYLGAMTLRSTHAGVAATVSNPASVATFGNVILVAAGGKLFYDDGALGAFTQATLPSGATAASVVVQKNHVLIVGDNNTTLYWSVEGDYTIWRGPADAVTSANVSAGYLLLSIAPGGAKAMVQHGEDVLILKTQSTLRGTYVGPPFYWRVDTVSDVVGTLNNGHVARIDNVSVWFLGSDGYAYLYDGALRPGPASLNYVLRRAWNSTRYGRAFQPWQLVYSPTDRNLLVIMYDAADAVTAAAPYYVAHNLASGLGTTPYLWAGNTPRLGRAWPLPSTQTVYWYNPDGTAFWVYSAAYEGSAALSTNRFSVTYRAVGNPGATRTLNQVMPLVISNAPNAHSRVSSSPNQTSFSASAGKALNTSTNRYDMLDQAPYINGRYLGVRQALSTGATVKNKVGPILMRFSNFAAD